MGSHKEQNMKYISLFSGIGGFDLGLDESGMECILQVEQDKYALEILHRHWPNVPKITDVKEVTKDVIDTLGADRDGLLIAGGFPCTGMSVAGLREGFEDPRSGLWMEFHRILSEVQPEFALIENVPGIFSSNKGRDFATLLRGLERIGYSDIAWRVLDSQHWVPQRRKRVFILARHTGTIAGRCAEILFNQSRLCRDTAESGQEGAQAARGSAEDVGSDGKYNAYNRQDRIQGVDESSVTLTDGGGLGTKTGLYHVDDVARTIRPSLEGKNGTNSDGTGNMIVQETYSTPAIGYIRKDDASATINAHTGGPGETRNPAYIQETSGTLQASDYKGARNFNPESNLVVEDTCGTLAAGAHPSGFNGQDAYTGNVVGYTVTSKWATNHGGPAGSASETNNCIQTQGAVRRLTPIECARLQGFPDDWNAGQSDAQRYKQFGNAVTVDVAKWIGERILECGRK
jgi:DNA (cytosine-5)-methyltransferase 1